MLKPKVQLAVIFLAGAMFFASAFPVNAAGLVPCGGPTENPCTVLDAFYMVARVTNWLILTAGIYAVYQIVSHSFWLAISSGDEEKIAAHKKGIKGVLIGFFVVMAAYMFVNTAVNILLMSKCKINFSSPWTYVTMTDPGSKEKCPANSYNVEGGIVPGK